MNTFPSRARWPTALIMVALILALIMSGLSVYALGPALRTEAQQRGQVFSTQSNPQTTLKGGVQQNVGKGVNTLGVNNTSSDYYVGQLLVDMYHQLSIMWGNASASQDAQRAFQYDVTQFGGFVSAGSTVAAKLAPCVSQYQQAYPHVVLQSQYYTQNNSSAFNSEGAIAKPLINAGASCVNTATADQFASNNGKTYNTYQSTPPPPLGPAPVYQAPSGAWTPRCQTPTSTNCYIWLLNRNGLYDHIYKGGPPNCSKGPPGGYDPSQNPACEAQGGNGGPRIPENSVPPTNNPANGNLASNAAQYLQGLAQGMGECLKGTFDMLGAAAQILSGDFQGAAKTLGLQPGQSIILRAIAAELNTQNIGVSPYQAGVTAGRRLCSYALIPGVAKAAGDLPGVLRAGGNVRNPLQAAAILNTPAAQLAGKFVKTPWGAKQLGNLVGKGASGAVYKLPGSPGRVIKIGNAAADTPASFQRQLSGYQAIEQSGGGIQTPTIYNSEVAPLGMPSYLILDDIFSKWPGANIVPDLGNLTAQQLAAAENLYNQLAGKGLIWADGHSSNIFFLNGPNGMAAGMVETDGLVQGQTWGQFRSADPTQATKVASILQNSGLGAALFSNFSPQSVMNALFQARFGPPN